MKIKTSLKAGEAIPLKKCRKVDITPKKGGNLITATCPFHGFWKPTKGWFPKGSKVFFDDETGELTTLFL